MNRLKKDDLLFENLSTNPPDWWNTLVTDKNIYIEIRKENYIDVYYNGGNIIKELRYKNGAYTGKVHYKYLLPKESEYIAYNFSAEGKSMIKKSSVNLIDFTSFDAKTLKRIKANISRYHPATSEKGVQARFILQKDSRFIDSEFAYNTTDENMRIDLIWLDLKLKKIAPVELKVMGDPRLYTHEIANQLKTYATFFENNHAKLQEYYKKLFSIKKRLNILSDGLKGLNSLDDFTIHTKPLLVIGGCSQAWIDKNQSDINELVKSVAYGTYFYGSVGVVTWNRKRTKNKIVFINS